MLAGNADVTRQTEAVFNRRLEAVMKMFAGEGSYDDVLAFHAEDFVWVSPAGTICGHEAAREYSARRMASLPAEAFKGLKVIQARVVGEYAFLIFKTDSIPFGTDTFIIRDGKIVFQSNAVYIPQQYRDAIKATTLPATA